MNGVLTTDRNRMLSMAPWSLKTSCSVWKTKHRNNIRHICIFTWSPFFLLWFQMLFEPRSAFSTSANPWTNRLPQPCVKNICPTMLFDWFLLLRKNKQWLSQSCSPCHYLCMRQISMSSPSLAYMTFPPDSSTQMCLYSSRPIYGNLLCYQDWSKLQLSVKITQECFSPPVYWPFQ